MSQPLPPLAWDVGTKELGMGRVDFFQTQHAQPDGPYTTYLCTKKLLFTEFLGFGARSEKWYLFPLCRRDIHKN